MLRLAELKLPLDHTDAELTQAVLRRLRIPPDQLLEQRLRVLRILLKIIQHKRKYQQLVLMLICLIS